MPITRDSVYGVITDTRDRLFEVGCFTVGNGHLEEVIAEHLDTVFAIGFDRGLGVECVRIGALDPWCQFSKLKTAVDKRSKCRRRNTGG